MTYCCWNQFKKISDRDYFTITSRTDLDKALLCIVRILKGLCFLSLVRTWLRSPIMTRVDLSSYVPVDSQWLWWSWLSTAKSWFGYLIAQLLPWFIIWKTNILKIDQSAMFWIGINGWKISISLQIAALGVTGPTQQDLRRCILNKDTKMLQASWPCFVFKPHNYRSTSKQTLSQKFVSKPIYLRMSSKPQNEVTDARLAMIWENMNIAFCLIWMKRHLNTSGTCWIVHHIWEFFVNLFCSSVHTAGCIT